MEELRLLEVNGYYNETDSFEFSEENSWTGYAILREDLTFEGVVSDFTSKDKDRLISGTLVEYNGVSLMKFTNGGFCPCSFYGFSTGKIILGNWSCHDFIFSSEKGRCKIVFTEIQSQQPLINEINNRIFSFKADMDNFSKEIYDSLIENIYTTVKNFIKNLENSKEDIEAEIGFPFKKLEL